MNNRIPEIVKEEKQEIESAISQSADNEFIKHEEVLDIFLNWEKSF